jgi:hypothetical protein
LWTLLVLTAPAAFLSGACTAATFWARTDGAGDAQRMTWLVAAITLAEAGGSMLAIRLPVLGARTQAALSVLGAVVMGVLLVQPWTLVPVVFVLSFLLGLAQPLRAAAVQRLAGDDVRARAASIANACDKVFDTIALVLAGASRRR